MIKVLMLVDHAVGISGPHRNVVGSLNALSARSDVDLRLLTGKIDENEPYVNRCDIQLGFEPHNILKALHNLWLLRGATKDRDIIYVPTGLKSFLYAYLLKGMRKLVAGPNVTGIPLLMNPANPSPLMTMRMSDAWIEMSEIRVKECVSAGTPRSYINLIPHSIDTQKFSPKFRQRDIWVEEGLDPEVVKIIYVGHLDVERKGVSLLISAYQKLKDILSPMSVDLILVGKGEHALTEDEREIPGIHILGARYGLDLIKLLASSDIFMAASRYETFWFTPLEAMSCGLPVVVSNAGAVPKMIPENGIQGVTVQITQDYEYLPDASEKLAMSALPLLQDKDLRISMGKIAREQVVKTFSEHQLGDQLMSVFASVAGIEDSFASP